MGPCLPGKRNFRHGVAGYGLAKWIHLCSFPDLEESNRVISSRINHLRFQPPFPTRQLRSLLMTQTSTSIHTSHLASVALESYPVIPSSERHENPILSSQLQTP